VDIALREIRYGRVWRANACRLVEERDGLLVLWSPRGNPRRLPVDRAGAEIRLPLDEPWELGEAATLWHSLGLLRYGARWSLWLHRDDAGRLDHWYVNFERHVGRSPRTLDYVDDKLDLVVSTDGSVRWKDEDELEEAARLGLLDADAIRAEAERVLADPPWPTGWEDWRPDPAWPAPRLPSGWDVV
jgi:hypothetical protein